MERPAWLDELRSRLRAMPDDRREEVIGAVLREAERLGMWMDDRDAGREVPIALQPAPVDPSAVGYLHFASWQMRRALQQLPAVVEADEQAAELLALGERERRWFERFRSPSDARSSRFCRVDALYRPGRAGDTPAQLTFIEPNVVGLGGLCYAVDAFDILDGALDDARPEGASERLAMPGEDPRRLLADELGEFAASRGTGDSPTVALVGSRSGFESDGEDRRLVDWLNEQTGLEVVFAAPQELTADEESVTAEGRPLDVVYRMMELSDLVDLEAEGADLEGMLEAFRRGIVVPTVGGDLEHKSVFELFTSDQFAHHFTERQRRVFDRHVAWTRLLTDRRTSAPSGRTVDLPTFVRRERRNLVLKPNRSYGGAGVQLGNRTPQQTWDEMVDRALEGDADVVVQELAPLVEEELPVRRGDGFEFREVYTVVGIFPSRFGCGLLGRYADEGVVNVSRSGGVVAYGADYA